MENNKTSKVIEINPITKGKRILIFLGDFFINFIVGFLLFNVLTVPIGKAITNYDSKNDTYIKAEKDQTDILYGNNLVFINDENYKYESNSYMKYTYDRFLSYYVIDGDEEFEIKDNTFGKNIENEVIKHYFIDLINDEDLYYSLFSQYNENVGYFLIEENNISLKSEYKEQLKDYFNDLDTMSESGLQLYEDVATNIFFALFAEILLDIETKHDLRLDGISLSFNELAKIESSFEHYYEVLITISAFIAYLISTILVHLLYPLIIKSRRTPTMSILKYSRINIHKFNKVNKKETFFTFIYALVFDLGYVMFLPASLVSFAYAFSFVVLVPFSIIAAFMAIISMIMMLFNEHSRVLSDRLTNTVLISEEDLNAIYMAKGYYDEYGR